MLEALVRSTSGPGLTCASCESTAPKTGSITSFAWQQGQTTCRFSPSFNPMPVLYSSKPKRRGTHRGGCPCKYKLDPSLSLGRVFSTGKARCGAKLGAHHLRVRGRSGLRRRCGWRTRLVGERLALHQHFHFVGINHFSFEK